MRYILVPEEPTPEMVEACLRCDGVQSDDDVTIFPARIWRAMVEAAPPIQGTRPPALPIDDPET